MWAEEGTLNTFKMLFTKFASDWKWVARADIWPIMLTWGEGGAATTQHARIVSKSTPLALICGCM